MAVARVHTHGGCRHAWFGSEPTRGPIQSRQGAVPVAAVGAVSIDPVEPSPESWITEVLDKPLETWNISIRAPTSIPSWVPDQKHRMTLTVCSLPLRPVTVTFSVGQLGT